MKVYRLTSSGVSIAIPGRTAEACPGKSHFFFSHGPRRGMRRGAYAGVYRLCLNRSDFPPTGNYDWEQAEYSLCGPCSWHDELELGNQYFLKSGQQTDSCICLLDMCPEVGATATLSYNGQVTVLGRGIGLNVRRRSRGGSTARRAVEIEYPVLLCHAGAKFAWTNHGLTFGRPADYKAMWDGKRFYVSPRRQFAVDPALIQRLEQPCRRHCYAPAI